MKKLTVFAICTILCIALAVPALAASQAADVSGHTPNEVFSDTFDSELNTSVWSIAGGNAKVESGVMYIGKDGNWTETGYGAYADTTLADGKSYSLEFDFTGDRRDCYYGVGIRAASGTGSNFMNGGRYGIPGGTGDTSKGICFDLHISKNQNAEAGGKMLGITLNNGQLNADAAQFLVAYPEGFDGSSGNVKIVDTVDKVTLYINGTEVATLVLSGLEDGVYKYVTAYDANGEKLYEGDCQAPAANTRFGFYQRNNAMGIDNVKVTHLRAPGEPEVRDFSSEKGDNLSFDRILYNDDVLQAEGTAAVNELKVLVDGSDGSISKVTMYGWYGNKNSKTAQYGYKIDGGEPVYNDAFFFETSAEDQAAIEGVNPNGYRYKVTVDVSKITDGKTHRIDVVAKLENGDIVTLNRNESGKDREVFVNYKSQAVPNAALDRFMVNGAGTNYDTRESGDSITIAKGDTIKALGWAYKYGTNVKRVYWEYMTEGGTFKKDGIAKECSDVYRPRTDVAGVFGYGAGDFQYFAKSGFGLDDNFIELLGVSELEAGTYEARFVAEFEDGTTEVIKKKFTLTVTAPATEVIGKNFDEVIFNIVQIKVRGWARLNSEIDAFGYKVDDAEIVYNDAFQVDRSDVWNAFGVTKELANGFLVELNPADFGEGKHTFTLYVKAKDGTVLELGNVGFERPHEETYETIVNFTDLSTYGMSFDNLFWNAAPLGGAGRDNIDLFANPDAMHANYYGGLATGFRGWVCFKQKVKGFGYLVNDKLYVSDEFVEANEAGLGDVLESWGADWAGSGEFVQRYNIQVPFVGMSGVCDIMGAAILEDGTVVRLNSTDPANRNTEIIIVFDDAETFYDANDGSNSTGWWTNPFNKDATAEIKFTAEDWFNGFELFVFASDQPQPVCATLKDAEGNAVFKREFTLVNNFLYTFYDEDAKFAPGEYTLVFDGTKMEDGASTWFVLASANAAEGKTISATGNTDENTLAAPYFRIIKTDAPEPQQPAEVTAEINDAGKLVVTVTGTFGEKDWIGVYAEGNEPGGDAGSLVWWYVGTNGGTFEVPFDGMAENDKAALLNDDGTVKEGKYVVYLLANDGYGLVEGTEGVTVTVEAQPATQPSTEPETQPQTGDAAVAMFAVIAVLAMGAAVVFVKKRTF